MTDQDANDGVGTSLVPDRIRRRFAWKFLAAVVVVMALTGLVGGVFIAEASSTLEGQVHDQVEATATLQANEIERWIDGLGHQTRTYALGAPSASGDRGMDAYLADLRPDLRSDVVAVHYVSRSNGTVLASTNESAVGASVDSPDWPGANGSGTNAGAADSSVAVIDVPYESTAGGARVIGFVSPVPDRPGGALVLEARFGSKLGSFEQTFDGAYTSVHGDGGLVTPATGRAKAVPKRILTRGSAGVTSLEDDTPGFDSNADELLGHAPVAGTDWTVVAHVPQTTAFSVRNQIGMGIAVVIIVPLGLLGAVGVVFGSRTDGALTRLANKAEAIENGNLDVELERRRADQIGQLTAAFDSMRAGLKRQIREADRARKEAEVSRQEAVEMNDHLERTADRYSEAMARCAAGDLTIRLQPDGENDAMDRIAEDFNEMIEELELTVGQLRTFADEVAETGETVETSAQSVRDAAEQVAESIQQVSVDAYEQQERLTDLTAEMDALAETLERYERRHDHLDFDDALDRIDAASATVGDVADLTEETTAQAETVAGAAEEQAAELTEVSQQANSLRKYARPLGEVLGRFKTEGEREFYFPSGPGDDADGTRDSVSGR